MPDLCERFEEIQGITRVFTGDLELLHPLLGDRSAQAASGEQESESGTCRRYHLYGWQDCALRPPPAT